MIVETQGKLSQESEAQITRGKIVIIWVITYFVIVVLSTYLTGAVLDLLVYLDFSIMLFVIPLSIAISIFHPGGWLSIIGLIFALKHRSYHWLYLSYAGAIITGISATFLVAVGMGSIAV